MTINNNDSIGKTPDLTQREQEIFGMLLDGIVPKEIAFNLKISYGTVLYHQRNLYRKLEVQSIQELFAKHLKQNESSQAMSRKPKSNVTADCYFTRIEETSDELGSEIFFKVEDEIIGDQNKRTYTFSGHLVNKHKCYATIFMIPHPSILAAMKKIKVFPLALWVTEAVTA